MAHDLTSSYLGCVDGSATSAGLNIRGLDGPQPGFRVSDPTTGLTFDVLYDRASRQLAERCAPYLAGLYSEIAALTSVDPASAQWHGVIFSETGELPDLPGERWPVRTVGGALDADSQRQLASVLPHEQTHAAVRMTANARALPRWYREGLASWVEQAILERVRPDLADARASSLAQRRAEATDLPALKDWGPLRFSMPSTGGGAPPRIVNGQLVMQTGPRDEEMMKRELASYATALDLFRWMEDASSRAAVVSWISAVSAQRSPPETSGLIDLARTHTGLDLTSKLN